ECAVGDVNAERGEYRLERRRMALRQIAHIAAIRGAGGGEAAAINIRQREHVVGDGHKIIKCAATPIAIDFVYKFLAISSGTARIGFDHDVARGSEDLGIPAIGPIVPPKTLRAAMDEENCGVFRILAKTGRLDHEALDPGSILAVGPQFFDGRELMAIEDGIVEVS